ncbi:hypothetical protein [Priestia megaterium]|uniref:hypothetical protein n=1 Tax=Priestia megaterium TaxID=1404 RepID=UPI0030F451BA
MSNETIVLKVNDIVQNPFLACDYLFTEEKRKQLLDADVSELRLFFNFIFHNKEKISEILSSTAYTEYVNVQVGVKNYSEQLELLGTIGTTVGDTVAGGLPIVTVVAHIAKTIFRSIKKKNTKLFVDEIEQIISSLHIMKRLDDINK